jgi:hypothetical protein
VDTLAFLQKVLPPGCIYFIDTPSPHGKGFKHFAFEDFATMAARAVQLDELGHSVYFACSGFREKTIEVEVTTPHGREMKAVSRVQKNVKLVRSFWLDLDVGTSEPGKPAKYPTQADAITGLGKFLHDADLPRPMIVSSGYGVHCYWPLAETMLPGQWKEEAERLKGLTKSLSLLVDQTRTADEASVLRPVGTFNRKNRAAPQPVALLLDVEPIPVKTFVEALGRAAKKHGVKAAPSRGDGDATFNPTTLIVPDGYQESSAKLIADRCNQVKQLRDSGGNVSEPQWYRTIQVLDKTIEGEAIIHEWSKPYKGYNAEETQRKIIQIKSMGPTTCAVLEETNPDGCKNCPFKGRIASPIQLGVEIKEAEAPKVTQLVGDGLVQEFELPNAPAPFKRGDAKNPGLYMELEPGVPIRFYPYDLFPIELAYDEQEKYMTAKVRHNLPHEGWADFPFRASLVGSVKEFGAAMIDRGVFPENAKVMAIYMDAYLKLLQSKMKSRQLYNSMGWKDENTKFLLGKNLYLPGGKIEPAGLSRRVSKAAVDGITKKGDAEQWKRAVAYFAQPGLEAHLFGFLAAFGSPLLKFTGFNGCVMSLLGDSNAGKSLTAMMALSVYGDYNKLRLGKNDTLNARIERMNSLSNIPIYVDEFTNTEPREASEFIYMASQGRGREKLFSDSTVRDAAEWSSITMVSSNKSLVGMLQLGKDNVEAEMLRLFEVWCGRYPWFEAQNRTMYELTKGNHGHAGEAYVRWLVENAASIKPLIDSVTARLVELVGFEGRERFWVSTAAVNIAGLLIAIQLGILPPELSTPELIQRLFAWVKETFDKMRVGLGEARIDFVDALGQFLNEHTPNTLIIEDHDMGGGTTSAVVTRTPVRELAVREERHTNLTYVDRKTLNHWLTRRQLDYDQMKKHLYQCRILKDHNEKKCLGAGFMKSTQVPVWVIDTEAPIYKQRVAEIPTQGAPA